MNNQEAYNIWASKYDIVENKTRDLEALALRKTLSGLEFYEVLELGCGTGKNTEWISARAKQVIGIDFSVEMLNKAKEKIKQGNIQFYQADITQKWTFAVKKFDLITCSLILEHIRDINFIFTQANAVLKKSGFFYIGELHPFKQYQGTRARFETEKGVFELDCYIHHTSDYFDAANRNGFECLNIREWFDYDDKSSIPRLISLLFKK